MRRDIPDTAVDGGVNQVHNCCHTVVPTDWLSHVTMRGIRRYRRAASRAGHPATRRRMRLCGSLGRAIPLLGCLGSDPQLYPDPLP
jgi:hypothetical protein